MVRVRRACLKTRLAIPELVLTARHSSIALRLVMSTVALITVLIVPRIASAQYVAASVTAAPNPFEPDDTVSLDVEGVWDSETVDWPCDMDWMDGGCAPLGHTFYVYGSDDFSRSWDVDDDLESSGWDSGQFDDDGSSGYPSPIDYEVDLYITYCDAWYSDCWDASAQGTDRALPVTSVTISCGTDTLWSLDGDVPDGATVQTECISNAGGSTQWYVDGRLQVSTIGEGEAYVWASSGVASGSYGDTLISASDGITEADWWVTVLHPRHAYLVSPHTYCPIGGADWGWLTAVTWNIVDQFDQSLTWGLEWPISEAFTDYSVDYPGGITSGWPMATPNGGGYSVTNTQAQISDWIAYYGPNPQPVPNINCSASDAVDHYIQTWSVSSVPVGSGTLTRTVGGANLVQR